jgi:hypothetical protein
MMAERAKDLRFVSASEQFFGFMRIGSLIDISKTNRNSYPMELVIKIQNALLYAMSSKVHKTLLDPRNICLIKSYFCEMSIQ